MTVLHCHESGGFRREMSYFHGALGRPFTMRSTSRGRSRAKDLVGVRSLGDRDGLVGGDVAECLGRSARRPGNRDRVDARRARQADRLDEAVAAEAGIVADGPVDRPRFAVGRLEVDPDPGADRRSVGLDPDQLDLQPVSAVARVAEQEVMRGIPGDRSARSRRRRPGRRHRRSRRRRRRSPSGGFPCPRTWSRPRTADRPRS